MSTWKLWFYKLHKTRSTKPVLGQPFNEVENRREGKAFLLGRHSPPRTDLEPALQLPGGDAHQKLLAICLDD